MAPTRLVLASASPRRRELLSRLALDFSVEPPHIDESRHSAEDPVAYVTRLARAKAAAAAHLDAVVIAADTAVVVDDEILGKPRDMTDEITMLDLISGRPHDVLTGVAVRVGSDDAVGVERTTVHVAELSPARTDWYAGTGEGADKAGGYAVQGAAALFADRIEGSVSNVIGLPLPLLDELCRRIHIDLLDFRSNS